jgi:hypothetical protein
VGELPPTDLVPSSCSHDNGPLRDYLVGAGLLAKEDYRMATYVLVGGAWLGGWCSTWTAARSPTASPTSRRSRPKLGSTPSEK